MLRPATPLSILFLAAFILLLLSTLSTPVIKAIPLASFQGYSFGVFGYCKGTECSGIQIGYNTDGLFTGDSDGDFSLPSSTRHSIASLLIVHPVAALMTLICFGLAAAAHFHSPSHSPRYLLGLLIFTFPTLLVCLLAFLVDLLLFVPNVSWGGWIVLAATIIITISGMVTCAMRRTLVSRRARKKRIAENAEMSGENYFATRSASIPKADTPPPIVNTVVADGNQFATFEVQQKDLDDKAPLKTLDGTARSQRGVGAVPPRMGPSPVERSRSAPRDQYGNMLPPGALGMHGDGPELRHHNSDNTMGSSRSRGPPPLSGRGRGGYVPRGGYPPRGGLRGGPQGMRGPPPPGWDGNGRGMGGMAPGPAAGMAAGALMGRGQRGPPPGYGNNYRGGPMQSGREPSPGPYEPGYGPPVQQMAQVPEQPPIGQAVPLDARNGSPAHMPFGLRDSDSDVEGLVAFQQQRRDNTPPRREIAELASPTSAYMEDAYVPPRAGWSGHGANTPSDSSRPTSDINRGLSPSQGPPVELDANDSSLNLPTQGQTAPTDSTYYEDVEPRFAGYNGGQRPPAETQHTGPLPNSLVAGFGPPSKTPSPVSRLRPPPGTYLDYQSGPGPLQRDSSGDSIEHSRSPATSENSHYTSVSQRGQNQNWGPPPGMPSNGPFPPDAYGGPGRPPQQQQQYYQQQPQQRQQPRQQDVVLNANPDFAIPGMSPGGRGGRSAGPMGRGRGGGGRTAEQNLPGMSGQGRYPDAI